MKSLKKAKMKIVVFLSLLFLNTFWCVLPVYSQEFEEAGALNAWKWYYRQRNYPRDTIPAGAYESAVSERNALIQSNGFMNPSLQWDLIGPMPFDWSYSGNGIPYSGRTNYVKYDPRDPNGTTIYITGPGCGIWKTANGGQTWENKSGDLPSLSAGAFAIDSINNTLYFGSGSGVVYFGDGLGMRIFKSTNDGLNWISISNGLVPGTTVYKIAINPSNTNNLYAATFHGLFKTTNAGNNWFKVIPITDYDSVCTDVCFSPSGNNVYAAGPSYNTWPGSPFNGIGFWRSTNGGLNFDCIPPRSGFPRQSDIAYGKLLCAVSHDFENILYLVNYENNGNVYLYRSTDGGSNFTSSYVGGTIIFYHLLVRCSDVNPDICFVGYEYISKTTNGGQNWTGASTTHADNLSLDFNPADPNSVVVGGDGGVFSSTNLGSSWSSLNQNLTLTLFWRVASDIYDENFLAGGMHDYGYGYKYPSGGPKYWRVSNSPGGDGGNMIASPFKSKHFVSSKVMWRSTNEGTPIDYSSDGINFTPTTDYILATWTGSVSPFAWHPTQPGTIYNARFYPWTNMTIYIFKSTNYGANWGGNFPLRSFSQPVDYVIPISIAISPSNPETIIMNLGNENEWWHYTYDLKSRLLKSTNGGLNWHDEEHNNAITPIVTGGQNGTPDRYFTDVEFDPKGVDTVYLTVSGYYYPDQNAGHIFKSTDGGYNWSSISGSLPDIPVNDLEIHYPDNTHKNLVIATDAGIYESDATVINWGVVAKGFPNTVAYKLDYNRLSGKLRANTWGYGAWECQLDNTIYIQDNLYITDNTSIDKDIVVCSGGKLILGYQNFPSLNIYFENGAKIIIEDGGILEANSGDYVTLSSQSSWGGIEIHGCLSSASLKNITFSNTHTPLTITGSSAFQYNNIKIENCVFNDGGISIDTRDFVQTSGCTFNYSGSYDPVVQGVSSVGSNNIVIDGNTVNSNTSLTGTGISVVYGTTVSVVNNSIEDAYNGISISNCDAYIYGNILTHSSPSYSNDGIGVDNCNSPTYSSNSISGYYVGLKFGNSSPVLYSNSTTNSGATYGMIAESESSPRMAPLPGGGELIYDAGYNSIITGNKDLQITNLSIPYLDYGQNYFEAGQNDYYIEGDIYDPFFAEYDVRCNDWNVAPNAQKFNVYNYMSPITVVFNPYNCDMPGGGGDLDPIAEPAIESMTSEDVLPPQPIIVDRGNGFYDTIRVISSSVSASADKILFAQATKQELLGNYTNAVSIFEQLIQSYPHTASSVKALGSVLYCFDRNHADSSNYLSLRNQYLTIAQTHITDTALFRAARNLAIKSLVKMKSYATAITEYENVISNSNDSLEILFTELNIIETYMLMNHQGGDAPTFTGKLTYLKPSNIQDGLRMIRLKYHSANKKANVKSIPKEFKLAQNYPNPFNPITTIEYALPQNSKVSIKIYDILGRLVKDIVNEYKEAGYYKVKFDGTNLASGVYFYRIEAGSFVNTKKMVLVK